MPAKQHKPWTEQEKEVVAKIVQGLHAGKSIYRICQEGEKVLPGRSWAAIRGQVDRVRKFNKQRS